MGKTLLDIAAEEVTKDMIGLSSRLGQLRLMALDQITKLVEEDEGASSLTKQIAAEIRKSWIDPKEV